MAQYSKHNLIINNSAKVWTFNSNHYDKAVGHNAKDKLRKKNKNFPNRSEILSRIDFRPK